MGGFIFGAIGGFMIALSFTKFENYQQFRWTIKLVCFGVGLGIISKISASLGAMIANIIIFGLVLGVVGIIVDLVKNKNNENKNSPTFDISQPNQKINLSKSEPSAQQNNSKSKFTSDEDIWALALEEFESKERIKGIYAKLYTQNDGDEKQIKSQYIKERFAQLKISEYTKNLQLTQQEQKLALESKENKKITSIIVYANTEFYIFEDRRVAIKVNETEYGLYENLKAAENAIDYSNFYGGLGFIGLIKIKKTI